MNKALRPAVLACWCGICFMFAFALWAWVLLWQSLSLSLLRFLFFKSYYQHQRRVVGVNLAPSWAAWGRTQWSSCAYHSRRGDALLWKGLLSKRTDGVHSRDTETQREQLHFKSLHSFPAAAGCWLWVFERIVVARREKVQKKNTRRERVGGILWTGLLQCSRCCHALHLLSAFPVLLGLFWMRRGTFTRCFTHWFLS